MTVDVREDERKQRVRDSIDRVARQVSDLAHNYRQRSPFRSAGRQPLDMGSPEYRDMSDRYSAHVDEMQGRYRSEMLPEVIRVRGALADFGITDAQLDGIYQRPQTFEQVEAIAERLWDMAGRLDRMIPQS